MLLVIGGTAAYHLRLEAHGHVVETCQVVTPWGMAPPIHRLSVPEGTVVWFASRHGEGRLTRSAAFVNHRALLWAAHVLEVDGILTWNGVGAIHPLLRVGDLVVPDDLLDWTRVRTARFGRSPAQRWSGPFWPAGRKAIVAAAHDAGETRLFDGGTYVVTEGPRLETAAEIEAAALAGADVVGMTLAPEVWLAAELGLPLASLCVVTNRAAGTAWRDERRDFSARVAHRALGVLLRAAAMLTSPEEP
ncbi:MAG: hypothetical protein Q9O62_03015 [Ardenticatenia bacterium]|nr:hypothetical protein [Ardenticatenia bacterium]